MVRQAAHCEKHTYQSCSNDAATTLVGVRQTEKYRRKDHDQDHVPPGPVQGANGKSAKNEFLANARGDGQGGIRQKFYGRLRQEFAGQVAEFLHCRILH